MSETPATGRVVRLLILGVVVVVAVLGFVRFRTGLAYQAYLEEARAVRGKVAVVEEELRLAILASKRLPSYRHREAEAQRQEAMKAFARAYGATERERAAFEGRYLEDTPWFSLRALTTTFRACDRLAALSRSNRPTWDASTNNALLDATHSLFLSGTLLERADEDRVDYYDPAKLAELQFSARDATMAAWQLE